jgi:aminoglycoside phosphotransferase (APT) family kinase protein
VHSKFASAEWGKTHIPAEYRALLAAALAIYRGVLDPKDVDRLAVGREGFMSYVDDAIKPCAGDVLNPGAPATQIGSQPVSAKPWAEIPAAVVERLLAEQFPEWSHLPIIPVKPGGWDNRTFRLGDELSVRLPSGMFYAAQVEKEQRWLPVLRRGLPLRIPEPVALGHPNDELPFPWSVYRWLPGTPAPRAALDDSVRLAIDLAGFLRALYATDPSGAPRPGFHNFFRGGRFVTYDGEARDAIEALGDEVDSVGAISVLDAAATTAWTEDPVWVHGDVAADNLLVESGRLSAVIDFGCCAAGDPACDLTIAWTFLSGASREAFRTAIAMEPTTWARARAWALWKAAIMLVKSHQDDWDGTLHRTVIDAVVAEFTAISL